ncbi:hypothetical protein D3C76_1067260 [compost metagenome]
MMVHICGIADNNPISVLLWPVLKLLTINGVQTAIIAKVLTRQKYTRQNRITDGDSSSRPQ